MAKLLNKITDTIKKVGETVNNLKNNSTETTSSSDYAPGSWISDKANVNTDLNAGKGTSTDYGSYKDDLERLSRAQSKAQVEQLKQARDKALSNLDVQEQQIKPTYNNARNQASATSQSGARSFAEYLANRGLTNSGASAQGEINRLSSLQNTLGGLDTAEANAYRDIANQRTAINNDYVAGVANANNAIAQQYYNNLLNYNQKQREYIQGLEEQALGRYANDYYQAYLDYINQGGSPNDLYAKQLLARSGTKQQTLTNNAIANGSNLVGAGIINYNTAGGAGMTVPEAQTYYNNILAQQEAQAQADADKLAWERQQQEIANAQKWASINNDIRNTNSLIESRKNNGVDEDIIVPSKSAHKNVINSNFAIDDGYGNIEGYDKKAILEYVQTENLNGRLSNKDAIDLLYDYGLKAEADALIGG